MESERPRNRAGSGNPTLVVCKPAFLAALRDEISSKSSLLRACGTGSGWLLLEGAPPPVRPFVFEQQRLPAARRIEGESWRDLAERARSLFAARLAQQAWTLHAYCPDPGAAQSLQKRAAGVGSAFLERLEPAERAAYREPRLGGVSPGERGLLVLQLCLTEQGLWAALAALGTLSSPWPGGVHRVAGATFFSGPRAPSRSYMKIEEALALFGEAPGPGQRVVDLGAAPGGWSYAFLRRGCRVTAVDRAALKLSAPEEWGGSLEHLREDGLRYRPPAPVDWVLSDMLIPPGVTLGLLRKWIGQGWARRFIVNVKLPQRRPYVALRPLETFLEQTAGVEAALRQLHHDRREVTAWGRLTPRGRRMR